MQTAYKDDDNMRISRPDGVQIFARRREPCLGIGLQPLRDAPALASGVATCQNEERFEQTIRKGARCLNKRARVRLIMM